MPFRYHAYGCIVASEMALPGLPEADGPPDMRIRFGRTPVRLPAERGRGACYSAAPGEALFWIDGVGRFHVSHGTDITIDASPDTDTSTLQLFTLNQAFGLLLQQRGDLVLHASAVEHGDMCIALAGVSGEGKSSVAAALHARGHQVLTDELCVIRRQPGGHLCVMPGPPGLHVWEDALQHLGHDVTTLAPVRPRLRKYTLPLGAGHATTPRPLSAVYVLRAWSTDAVETTVLSGARQFEAITHATYRFEYVPPMGLKAQHFGQVAALGHVPTVLLRHPMNWRSMDAMIARLGLLAAPQQTAAPS